MKVRVLLFGPAAAAVGRGEAVVKVDAEGGGAGCEGLRVAMGEQYPVLGRMLGGARFAVNQRFAEPGQTIGSGDEVALITLVSGG